MIDDRLGRRKTIFLGGLLAGVGQILQCTAFYLPQFIIGRFVLGLGVGQVNVIVPVWQSECSSAHRRGRQVITAGIFISVGFVLPSWINFGFKFGSSPPLQWRIPLTIPIRSLFAVLYSPYRNRRAGSSKSNGLSRPRKLSPG